MTKISRLIEIFRFIRQIYLVYTPQQDFGFLSATNRRRIRRRINRDCLTERAKLRKHRLEKNMYRMLPASLLLVAFTAASSAQDLSPSVWQSQSGAILKVLNADPATGNLTGVFISSPTGHGTGKNTGKPPPTVSKIPVGGTSCAALTGTKSIFEEIVITGNEFAQNRDGQGPITGKTARHGRAQSTRRQADRSPAFG